jgi:hypothetical protein
MEPDRRCQPRNCGSPPWCRAMDLEYFGGACFAVAFYRFRPELRIGFRHCKDLFLGSTRIQSLDLYVPVTWGHPIIADADNESRHSSIH